MTGQDFFEKVVVSHDDFDLSAECALLRSRSPESGAVASFVGVVRNHNDGSPVTRMTLEHYPGMTEKSLSKIIDGARRRWPITGVVVHHRVGPLELGDQIVLVAVASAHRQAAFMACEFIMDWLKTEAPFWKKEATPEGERWVDARESDEEQKARWGDWK